MVVALILDLRTGEGKSEGSTIYLDSLGLKGVRLSLDIWGLMVHI